MAATTVCASVLQDAYYVSGKGITQALVEMQLQLYREWTQE